MKPKLVGKSEASRLLGDENIDTMLHHCLEGKDSIADMRIKLVSYVLTALFEDPEIKSLESYPVCGALSQPVKIKKLTIRRRRDEDYIDDCVF